MNSEELKNLIESARVEKGISQRELAKLTGISRSTLNDLINGKIKKVDIDDLRKIAETLDMSLQKLLKAAGYDGAISIEHEDGLMSPKEGLEKAVSFLKNVLIYENAGEMWWV